MADRGHEFDFSVFDLLLDSNEKPKPEQLPAVPDDKWYSLDNPVWWSEENTFTFDIFNGAE